MYKFIKKIKISLLVFLFFFCFVFIPKITKAQITQNAADKLNPIADVYGASSSAAPNIAQIIASIIQYALSFLGVIFLVLLIYGGFLWMTAGGDQEKVTKSKEILRNVLIGLIIILGSYTITYFVIENLTKASGTYY